jgi:hypothetical protein
MKESEITDEQILKETRQILQNPHTRRCSQCANADEECTWCSVLKKPLAKYMYAGLCKYYETQEDRMIKQMREALKAHEKEQRKVNYLLTMSLNCIEVAMLFMEDFNNRVESEYKRAEQRGVGDARVRKADRLWMGNLKKATKAMKTHLDGVQKQYNHYVMPLLNKVFYDKDKKEYDCESYDDHMSDSNELAQIVLRYFDVAFNNVKNAQALLNIMKEMKGSGALEEGDYKRYNYRR